MFVFFLSARAALSNNSAEKRPFCLTLHQDQIAVRTAPDLEVIKLLQRFFETLWRPGFVSFRDCETYDFL